MASVCACLHQVIKPCVGALVVLASALHQKAKVKTHERECCSHMLQVTVRGVGELVMLASAPPTGVTLDGAPAGFAFDATQSRLSVELPPEGPLEHTLLVNF